MFSFLSWQLAWLLGYFTSESERITVADEGVSSCLRKSVCDRVCLLGRSAYYRLLPRPVNTRNIDRDDGDGDGGSAMAINLLLSTK
ncbi:uncharacterized protein BO87DRAFT_175832 [Aspergillus neoniger CBS 115656]|uniref:Secreted protein n=1 Tax=Aspergillus neoniger (strain CBS 115656) TaxID=1448310 RepID=A0A318Y746_ASPNB|nr:hypothetical protein BO87DRAFT_175832 [Aspergillus neoniger CBS 115656]PYH29699.1 hypothetical protein BO87DRAFT_175832 [Aspergillus neoniger CBS 115656]